MSRTSDPDAAPTAGPAPEAAPASDHVDRLRAQWSRQLPDLDTEPMAILGRAMRATLLARPDIEATFARHGLDRGEFDVIATLLRAGPPHRLTPTQIYSTLMISSGGLTHRLDRLERAGLVRRERSSRDGRSIVAVLTEAGAAKAEAAFREDMTREARRLAHLSPEERSAIAVLLRKLLAGMEADPAAAPES